MLSLATSEPTCTPPYVSWNFVVQVVDAAPVPKIGLEMVPVMDWLLFIVSSPPTPRTHTPPPSWPGCGLAGALTNAVLCVRNAVFAATTSDEPVTAAAAADETMPMKFWPVRMPVPGSAQKFGACALEAANSEAASTSPAPAAMRRPRGQATIADSSNFTNACSEMSRITDVNMAAPV